jgi:hypothetical protein
MAPTPASSAYAEPEGTVPGFVWPGVPWLVVPGRPEVEPRGAGEVAFEPGVVGPGAAGPTTGFEIEHAVAKRATAQTPA